MKETDRQVLNCLLQTREGLERDQIARVLGLARTTVYDSLMRLKLQQMVLSRKLPRDSVGRRKICWEPNTTTWQFVKKRRNGNG